MSLLGQGLSVQLLALSSLWGLSGWGSREWCGVGGSGIVAFRGEAHFIALVAFVRRFGNGWLEGAFGPVPPVVYGFRYDFRYDFR
jgi:hypothetical protein